MKKKKARIKAKSLQACIMAMLRYIDGYQPFMPACAIQEEYSDIAEGLNRIRKVRVAISLYCFFVLPYRLARRVVRENWLF